MNDETLYKVQVYHFAGDEGHIVRKETIGAKDAVDALDTVGTYAEESEHGGDAARGPCPNECCDGVVAIVLTARGMWELA